MSVSLSKEQVQQIDNCLTSGGIKYWDLRIEMIDHVVTEIEQSSANDNFEIALNRSLKKLKWSGNLSAINTNGWQNVNKMYRKKYLENIKTFLKNPLILFFVVLSLIANYFLFDYLSLKTFKLLNFSSCIIISIPFFILTTKLWFKKYGRSVHLDYGIFYFGFSLIMINLPIQFSQYFQVFYQKVLLIILLPIFILASISGYCVFKESIQRVERIRKELNL